MKQRIIINADTYETRVAILEHDELAELFVERAEQRRNVGDVYKARVNAVLAPIARIATSCANCTPRRACRSSRC